MSKCMPQVCRERSEVSRSGSNYLVGSFHSWLKYVTHALRHDCSTGIHLGSCLFAVRRKILPAHLPLQIRASNRGLRYVKKSLSALQSWHSRLVFPLDCPRLQLTLLSTALEQPTRFSEVQPLSQRLHLPRRPIQRHNILRHKSRAAGGTLAVLHLHHQPQQPVIITFSQHMVPCTSLFACMTCTCTGKGLQRSEKNAPLQWRGC